MHPKASSVLQEGTQTRYNRFYICLEREAGFYSQLYPLPDGTTDKPITSGSTIGRTTVVQMKMAFPIFVAHYCSETVTTCTIGTNAHEPAGRKAAWPRPGYGFPPVSLMSGFIQVLLFSIYANFYFPFALFSIFQVLLFSMLQLLLTINNRQLTLCPTRFTEPSTIRSRSQNKHTPPKIKFKYPDY